MPALAGGLGFFVGSGVMGGSQNSSRLRRKLGVKPLDRTEALTFDLPGGVTFTHAATVSQSVDETFRAWNETYPHGFPGMRSAASVYPEQREVRWRDGRQAARIRFLSAPGNRGTEVRINWAYRPLAGTAELAVRRVSGRDPWWQVRRELRLFKQTLEAGETATNQGQPRGA